jgi:hypothetical protein
MRYNQPDPWWVIPGLICIFLFCAAIFIWGWYDSYCRQKYQEECEQLWLKRKQELYHRLKDMEHGNGTAACITITGYKIGGDAYIARYAYPAWNETHIVRPNQPEDLPKLVEQINAVYPRATVVITILSSR